MNCNSAFLSLASLVIAMSAGPGVARALHIDVLIQQKNGQLVTGAGNFDNDTWTLGQRAYHRDLNPAPARSPMYLQNSNPGFNSIGDGSPDMPAGAQALLPNVDSLSWDFLPMTVTNGNSSQSQNLFYWNGQDSDGVPGFTPADVQFGPLPTPNYRLSLDDNSGFHYSVDGTNTIVPGGPIVETGADGSLHWHLPFTVQDNDGNSSTLPVDGFYLIAMRMKLPGLADSFPIFLLFGTPGSSISAENDAAYPWVEQGDYNQDSSVDAADYVLARKTGIPSYYNLWRTNFGRPLDELRMYPASGSVAGLLISSAPEPSGWIMCGLLAAGGYGLIRKRRIA